MPTLVTTSGLPPTATVPHPFEAETPGSVAAAGETARASDWAWISQELLVHRRPGATTVAPSNDVGSWGSLVPLIAATPTRTFPQQTTREADADRRSLSFGSTLSRTIDPDEVEEVDQAGPSATTGPVILPRDDDHDDTSITGSPTAPPDMSPIGRVGPWEQKYHSCYRSKVQTWLQEGERRSHRQGHPPILSYGALEPPAQRRALDRVQMLLRKLCIPHHAHLEDDDGDAGGGGGPRAVKELNDSSITLSQPPVNSPQLSSPAGSEDHALPLFTPPHQSALNDDSSSTDDHDHNDTSSSSSSSSSTLSIELARSARRVHPPQDMAAPADRKRSATSSGKRGLDVARPRVAYALESGDANSSSNSSDYHVALPDDPEEDGYYVPGRFAELANSLRRMSLKGEGPDAFETSQSPIGHCPSISSSSECSSPKNSKDRRNPSRERDHVDRYDDSIEESAPTDRKPSSWWQSSQPLREVSTNVGLRKGATLHFEPLLLQHHHPKKAPYWADPFDKYPAPIQTSLGRVYDALGDETQPTRIFLSLTDRQIMDVMARYVARRSSEAPSVPDEMNGQTLIVARSKEDLVEWARALRECSPLSVLNYASMPSRERAAPGAALKCSKYDVVLTTYDGLKSADTTVALDENGFVLQRQVGLEDGWYKSRGGSQPQEIQRCVQLSSLHRLSWSRVVLVDCLGRKCFLAKPDTSRVKAARALNARSRLIFFVKDDDEKDALKSLIRSDKCALSTLAYVLREPLDKEGILAIMADMDKKRPVEKR